MDNDGNLTHNLFIVSKLHSDQVRYDISPVSLFSLSFSLVVCSVPFSHRKHTITKKWPAEKYGQYREPFTREWLPDAKETVAYVQNHFSLLIEIFFANVGYYALGFFSTFWSPVYLNYYYVDHILSRNPRSKTSLLQTGQHFQVRFLWQTQPNSHIYISVCSSVCELFSVLSLLRSLSQSSQTHQL